MIITFCGHGDIEYTDKDKEKLYNTIIEQIEMGANRFLLGGYGNFDLLAAHMIKKIKASYSYIASVLIVPYIDRVCDKALYDFSEYPPIESTPKKFAIIKRNQWMVDHADVVIAYVSWSWGGAARMHEYAKRRKKKIINICDTEQ